MSNQDLQQRLAEAEERADDYATALRTIVRKLYVFERYARILRSRLAARDERIYELLAQLAQSRQENNNQADYIDDLERRVEELEADLDVAYTVIP